VEILTPVPRSGLGDACERAAMYPLTRVQPHFRRLRRPVVEVGDGDAGDRAAEPLLDALEVARVPGFIPEGSSCRHSFLGGIR